MNKAKQKSKTINLSEKEFFVMKELLDSEIFNLSGIVRIYKDKELKSKFNILQSIGKNSFNLA